MGIWHRLDARANEGFEAEVALLGAGFVGRAVLHRLVHTPGLRVALVVNRSPDNGCRAYAEGGVPRDRVLVSDDADVLRQAVADKRPVVATDPAALSELPSIDVAVEATGALSYGAAAQITAMDAGKHVVSMNAEADATVGALLHRVAAQQGVVYTISDGDQPGVLLRLAEEVQGMGFDLVAALNCKQHLDVHQSPAASDSYARRDGTSPSVTTSAGDGTKMNIENAVVANATGLVPDRRGMHGVRTTRAEALADVLGVVSRRGIVDYTLGGDFGPGVCIIGHADAPDAGQQALRFYKMGPGPDYLFFRPYHLVHLEVARSIAEVVLDRDRLGAPVREPVTEVVAIAKRDLAAGEPLDGIGGTTTYGQIDQVERTRGLLPIGFTDHARVRRAVRRDEPIMMDAVELDEDAPIVRLRRRQDTAVSGV